MRFAKTDALIGLYYTYQAGLYVVIDNAAGRALESMSIIYDRRN